MLSFQQIREQVMEHLRFDMSAEYADLYLKVEKTFAIVANLQKYTQAFYASNERIEAPALLPLSRFKMILQKIHVQATLEPKEALQVANLYVNASKINDVYGGKKEEQWQQQIDKIVSQLMINDGIVKEIRRVITKDALIADDASATLQTIRLSQRETEQSIRRTLTRLLQSEQLKLAENLYTVRNGRYVLPIKAEFKNTFAGILHDQSASGTTAYMEPQALVTINNKLQQLAIAEKQEIDKILTELSTKIFVLEDEMTNNTDVLARFDIYQAKALYAFEHQMAKVEIVERQEIKLYDAKHPLLQQKTAVGNDIFLGATYSTLMITGANTGGKSVFLKTVGLLSLMAQTGLFLPVSRDQKNQIGVFKDVFLAIGDEQSLEANLSTFSGHISMMKPILAQSNAKSLVLLDELGTGTDPVQGAALAIAMIEYLAANGALIVGTTHFNEMKTFITETTYAENAAMTFDLPSLQPTFKIRYGSYGSSYAFDIAEALALPLPIIASARKHAQAFAHESDALLTLYEQKLQTLDERNELLDAKEQEVQEAEQSLKNKQRTAEKDIARERRTIVSRTEREMTEKLTKIGQLLETVKQKSALKQNEYADLKGELNKLQMSETTQSSLTSETIHPHEVYAIGDVVYIKDLQTNGTIVKQQGENWLIKVGKLSMTVPETKIAFAVNDKGETINVEQIRQQGKRLSEQRRDASNQRRNTQAQAGNVRKQAKNIRQQAGYIRKQASAVPDSLDLRGFRVIDAITALELYLANARSTHKVVRIIHGHGTGQVRDAVQTTLRQTKSVKNFRFGGQGEGGVGATIVEFY